MQQKYHVHCTYVSRWATNNFEKHVSVHLNLNLNKTPDKTPNTQNTNLDANQSTFRGKRSVLSEVDEILG